MDVGGSGSLNAESNTAIALTKGNGRGLLSALCAAAPFSDADPRRTLRNTHLNGTHLDLALFPLNQER